MIASGSADPTARPTEAASSPSMTTARAPIASISPTLAADVVDAVTAWPCSTSWGTSRLPSTPLPPATNTRIPSTLPLTAYTPQTTQPTPV